MRQDIKTNKSIYSLTAYPEAAVYPQKGEGVFSALALFIPFKVNDEFSLVPSFRRLLSSGT